MKKLIISLTFVLITITSLAQVKNNESTSNDNAQNNSNYGAVSYRLFPTQNMWTFIKLNTRNGRMWQVQYDVKESNRFETNLNFVALVTKEEEHNDRFTLYPTQNIYTFILLDQLDGRTWQVQWSLESEKRFVIPIE
jgi:hypothetical protein